MALKKDFYDYQSFCEAIGADEEALRQALARGELDAYLHPKNDLAQLRFYSAINGVGPESGRNRHATWCFDHDVPDSQYFHYRLTGWFRVDPECLQEAALKGGWRGPNGSFTPVRVVPPSEQDGLLNDGDVWEFTEDVQNEYEGSFWTSERPTYVPSLEDLWFSASTVERLQLEGVGAIASGEIKTDKPLSSRERNNLLRIIAALAKHADIDISERSDGAAKVESLLTAAGFDGPKVKTVREVLAAARDLD